MLANYPDSVAVLTNPGGTEHQNVPSHSEIETQQNLEIIAIQNELGLGLKGALSDLATRLNVGLNSDGSLKTTETDPLSLHLNGDNSFNFSGSVTRDANGLITSFLRTGGLTFTPTRDVNGFITSITDGTKTWTFTRTNGYITSWSVA